MPISSFDCFSRLIPRSTWKSLWFQFAYFCLEEWGSRNKEGSLKRMRKSSLRGSLSLADGLGWGPSTIRQTLLMKYIGTISLCLWAKMNFRDKNKQLKVQGQSKRAIYWIYLEAHISKQTASHKPTTKTPSFSGQAECLNINTIYIE